MISKSRRLFLALALTLPVAGPAVADVFDIRFVENHDDRVALELVRRPDADGPPEPAFIVATPADAACSVTGPVEGMVRVAGEGVFRGVKLVSLEIDPSKPAHLEKLPSPTPFQLAFDRSESDSRPPLRPPSPYFEPVFRTLVLNHPFPDRYRAGPHPEPANGTRGRPVPAGVRKALKIEVEGPGRVRIGLDRLNRETANAWSLEEARSAVRLWLGGRPHPFAIGREGAGRRVVLWFDAAPFDSRYTAWDAYWLTWVTGGEAEAPTGTPRTPGEDPGLRAQWRTSLRRFSGELRTPTEGADVLYVCHPEFVGEIGPLVEWRRRQGLRAAVVRSDEIADEFNFGRDEPEAIQRFLAWACSRWPAPAPAFVVLVGDASARPKSTSPDVSRNFIATVYHPGDDSPAHDDGYVEFAADGRFPQMMLGRISVNQSGQLAAIVEKLIAHERRPQPGRWRGKLLLLADNNYERLFDESVTRYIPPHLDVLRIDVRDFPFVDHYNLDNVKISPACRDEVVRRLNDGAAAVHYVGHGGVSLISHEKMLFWTDVARLQNAGRLPLFVQISCRTGGFDFPEQEWNACLSELLLRSPGGGALGVLAASRAIFGDEAYLQRLLFRSYHGRRVLTLGDIKIAMKIPYLLKRPERDFIDSYNLLGDPASRIAFPGSFRRLVALPERLTLKDGAAVRVEGEFQANGPASVELQWRGPAGGLAGEVKRLETTGGRFETGLLLPDGAEAGEWTLVAHAVAENSPATDFQGVCSVWLAPPPRDYPNDPAGVPDLAFVDDGFEFVDKDPTDGHTIRIRATIENRGTARSGPSRLTWSWKKNQGGEEVARVASSTIPALYPTERVTLQLRWDPTGVAGEIECALEIAPASREVQIGNNRVARRLRIRTKPDLAPAGAPACRVEKGRLLVALAIQNLGETAAKDVEVTVSVGDANGPQSPLARSLRVAERLEGGATTPVRRWAFVLPQREAPKDYFYIEIRTAEPVAEITKKNNRFRISPR